MSNRDELIEELSSQLHDIYIIEAKRQGDVRHKDKYEDLPENIKEFDRVLARFIISREAKIVEPLVKVMNYYEGYPPEDTCNKAIDQTLKNANLL